MVAKCSAFIVQLLSSIVVHHCYVAGGQLGCFETLRYQGGNQNVPAEMKIPLKKWRSSILEENVYIQLCEKDVGCQSLFCEDNYGKELLKNASAVTSSDDLLSKLLFGNDPVNASTTENPVKEASTRGTSVLLLLKPGKKSSAGAVTLSNGLLLVLLFGALFFN
uniref:MANEC domain-containing protein n=1 Tax=Globodera pallida TaxID=36090 RepID=A0A183C3M9_GLOPA